MKPTVTLAPVATPKELLERIHQNAVQVQEILSADDSSPIPSPGLFAYMDRLLWDIRHATVPLQHIMEHNKEAQPMNKALTYCCGRCDAVIAKTPALTQLPLTVVDCPACGSPNTIGTSPQIYEAKVKKETM